MSERFEEFYQKFCYLECGQSAKRVVDEVFLKKTIPVKKVVSNEDYEYIGCLTVGSFLKGESYGINSNKWESIAHKRL
ncbi:CDP-glycerol glycerophosphotransferase family protein [Peribacillus butanolivorans]